MTIATVRTPLRRTTVAEALAAMGEFPLRMAKRERLGIAEAEGRILAEAARAREDVPAFARSMVDGFAVVSTDVLGASRPQPVRLQLAGEIAMGQPANLSIRSGQAAAVPTGGALPEGTTGVVKIEDTDIAGSEVIVYDGAASEQRITAKAADVAAADMLFERGCVLDPAALGLLAAAGVDAVTVYRPPQIGILVTGDELAAPGDVLHPGQIRESNGVALSAALAALGFAPRRYDRVSDDREVYSCALTRALDECDGVVISGGSSVGSRDYTPALVAQAGEPGVIVHGVRVKPGRPVLLGIAGDRPIVGLPGNPVSALVMFEVLAKPLLLRMFDKVDSTLPLRARLEAPIDLDPDLEYRIPVQLRRTGEGLSAKPLLGTSSQMHILGFADALIVVPEGRGHLSAGTWVDALPLTRSRTMR